MFEIWVYSPRVEGVHLRMGKVARGGLRWSDRREDFRTEILGLMKAQNVKNTLIVPVGAKGGFVPKQMPAGASREEVQREGTECYRLFIRGLLDITDNVRGDKLIPPERTVRYDPDDPYLVVAADKGTATFSDTANALAAEYGFWLGDAFASGGSAGYDHKKMGITAKGALGVRQAPLPRTRPRHAVAGLHASPASATWPATCSATACCCRRTSGWWPHSTTSTSSSTRSPTRRAASRSASACSTCRARRGPTTTRS